MVEKVIQLLEEERLPFLPNNVAQAVRKYGLEVEDLDGLGKEVMAEGVRRTMTAVEKFFETLDIPAPLSKMEEALWKGGEIWVSFPDPRVGRRHFTVAISYPTLPPPEKPWKATEELTFPMTWWHEPLYGPIKLHASPGEVGLKDLFTMDWERERAIFRATTEKDVKWALGVAQRLEPFLSHIGLDGMAGALGALGYLKKGEAQVEGDYVLARTDADYRYEGDWLLRRGTILGDPELDKAALLGEEVKLGFPGDVEISFRCRWDLRRVRLDDVHLRLGDKVLDLSSGSEISFMADSLSSDPIGKAIQYGLKTYFEGLQTKEKETLEVITLDNTPPRMLTFLQALAEHQDPFGALAEGRLAPYVRGDLSPEL
jgi:hypothetical protein